MPVLISSGDLGLLAQSRTKPNFTSLSQQEREAYGRIHAALELLGAAAVDALGGTAGFASKLTSGFSPQSGVRGSLPKDLWFAAYNRSNADTFVGMPQVFTIVSARGVELGFAATIHPSDFSQQAIKERVRRAAPRIFAALPAPGSPDAAAIADDLRRTGATWLFRRKTRLDPGIADFPGLDEWLAFLRSEEGGRWAGGSISRYLRAEDLDGPDLDLEALVREAAAVFAPIMRSVVPAGAAVVPPTPTPPEGAADDASGDETVRPALEEFLAGFQAVRSTAPFGRRPELWALMERLQRGFEALPPLRARPRVRVSWSLGKGVWAEVPWVAFMDDRETRSTRQGTHAVLLFRQDLSGAYLTLNQGATELVAELGRPAARDELRRRAARMRALVPDLASSGFVLDGDIDLRTGAALGVDYGHGTMAHKLYPTGSVPPDPEIAADLEALLEAYARVLAAADQEDTSTSASAVDAEARRVWLWAPGEGAAHWDELYEAGRMAIGWDELGDLGRFASREDLASTLAEAYRTEARPTNDARTCYDFVHAVRPGDLVFAKRGRSTIVGHGVVAGGYEHDPSRAALRNVRAVRWLARGEWQSPSVLPVRTLTDIGGSDEAVDELLALVGRPAGGEAARPVPAPERRRFTVDDAMDGLFMPRAEFERALGVWRARRNLVVQGAPGVGKSFVARRLAYALMGHEDPSRVRTVQFHQSYAYEDFVQGFRPAGPGGGFALREGVFLEFCRRALAEPGEAWVFVVDEINRGNLSKILGELMLLIEPDKRSPEWALKLAYAERPDERFYVPPNVFLLGMMNTADRSLAVVDYALRRRFAFVTLTPAFGAEAFAAHLRAAGLTEGTVERVRARMGELNEAIAADRASLGPGFCAGHSFFASPPGRNGAGTAHGVAAPSGEAEEDWYRRVVETEIAPLLAEYWFDDPAKAEDWRARLLA